MIKKYKWKKVVKFYVKVKNWIIYILVNKIKKKLKIIIISIQRTMRKKNICKKLKYYKFKTIS